MNKIRIYGHVDGVEFDKVMEFRELTVDQINELIQHGTGTITNGRVSQWLHFEDSRGQHMCINFGKASVIEVRAIDFQ